MRLILILPLLFLVILGLDFFVTRNKLSVSFCDVGQGDSALVSKATLQLLVDAGPGDRVLECLDRRMPFFDKRIEILVLTHPQQDHIEGFIHVLDYYSVKEVWMSSAVSKAYGFKSLIDKIRRSGVTVREVFTGDKFIFDRLEVEVLWPERGYFLDNSVDFWSESDGWSREPGVDPNYVGTVLEIKYGGFELLLTADVDREVQPLMMELGVVSTTNILKVPHHGSRNGILPEWLEAVSPQLGVISSGKGNPYGHPAEETLELLSSKDIKILRTDERGDVVIESNGKKWWIK